MNHRLKFVFSALLALTIATLIPDTYRTKAQLKSMSASLNQAQDRIMGTKADFNPPIKITAVKTKRGELKTDRKFFADDDWLQGLTVQVANQSGKTVTFIGIELTFFRGDDQAPGLPVSWPFKYGLDPFDSDDAAVPHPQVRSIQPGEKIDIILLDGEYEEIKKGLRETHLPTSIKKVEMRVLKIGFDDGTAWNAGYMFRRDPKNMREPLKGWTPIEDPPKNEFQLEQPTSSTQNRTAFILKIGLTLTEG